MKEIIFQIPSFMTFLNPKIVGFLLIYEKYPNPGSKMWKIKLQEVVGNLLAWLNLAKWKKILGKICFSEQIFYRKQSLDALDQNCEKQQ